MSRGIEEKLRKIQELLERREKIDVELELLLSPEKEVLLPIGFSLNTEVLQLIKEAGAQGIDAKRILATLRQKYPKYGIERRKVASALAYLKNTKKQITLIGRGVYKEIEKDAGMSSED